MYFAERLARLPGPYPPSSHAPPVVSIDCICACVNSPAVAASTLSSRVSRFHFELEVAVCRISQRVRSTCAAPSTYVLDSDSALSRVCSCSSLTHE